MNSATMKTKTRTNFLVKQILLILVFLNIFVLSSCSSFRDQNSLLADQNKERTINSSNQTLSLSEKEKMNSISSAEKSTELETYLFDQSDFEKEVSKFYELGKFYRRVYLSELLFNAMVETEQLKHLINLKRTLLKENVVENCSNSIEVEPEYLFDDSATVLKLKKPRYECQIQDFEKLYSILNEDEFVSYFRLRDKCGSFWVYLDLNSLSTADVYFLYAFFVEKGFEPEFNRKLKLFVLAQFDQVEDALELKKMFSDFLDLKVDYVICRDFDYEKRQTAPIREIDFSDLIEPESAK